MRNKRGLTLIEVAVSLVLTSIVGTAILLVVSSGSDAMQLTAVSTLASTNARDAIEEVTGHLVGADLASILPVDVIAPASSSRIRFQRVIDFQGGGVVWSNPEVIQLIPSATDPNDGIDNVGNGLVDECRVVWIQDVGLVTQSTTVLMNWVQETLAGELAGNGLDDNGNGLIDEPGLSFDYDGRRLSVHISVEMPSGGLQHVATSSVHKVIVLNAYGT